MKEKMFCRFMFMFWFLLTIFNILLMVSSEFHWIKAAMLIFFVLSTSFFYALMKKTEESG